MGPSVWFFITSVKDGEILEEIEANEKIADDVTGALEENITITKVTVDTFGYEYTVKKN